MKTINIKPTVITMTPEQAYYECRLLLRRDKDLEKIIIKDSWYAYRYAIHLIKGRWIEAESVIATDSKWTFRYARDIIEAKLPENMHNTMLLYADDYLKLYFDFIKHKTQQ